MKVSSRARSHSEEVCTEAFRASGLKPFAIQSSLCSNNFGKVSKNMSGRNLMKASSKARSQYFRVQLMDFRGIQSDSIILMR